jgi:hypothetical protein
LEAQFQLPAGSIMQIAFARDRLECVVTGKISDATWRDETAQELLRRYPESSALAAIRTWSASPGEINSDVLTLTQQVRLKSRLVLITNGTDRLHDDLLKLGLIPFRIRNCHNTISSFTWRSSWQEPLAEWMN